MTQTIDVSGLSAAVVSDLQRLVQTLRTAAPIAPAVHSAPSALPREETPVAPPLNETPEEWVARFRAWAASHPPVVGIADDSRESIYEGRGE